MPAQESPKPKQLTTSDAWKIYREYDVISTPDLFHMLYPDIEEMTDIGTMVSLTFIGLYANQMDKFIEFINGMKKHDRS